MRSSLARRALVVALSLPCLSVTGWALAESGSGPAEVLATERQWAQSLVSGDRDALDRIYADDLVYVHSGGDVETKAQFLERLRKGSLRYQKVELVDPKVRLYGAAAVVNGAFDVGVQVDGQPVNARVVYIHVYARQGERWRLVAHQTTRAPAQP